MEEIKGNECNVVFWLPTKAVKKRKIKKLSRNKTKAVFLRLAQLDNRIFETDVNEC